MYRRRGHVRGLYLDKVCTDCLGEGILILRSKGGNESCTNRKLALSSFCELWNA